MSGPQGWIGVDLDGTLAVYDGWVGPAHIGPPVPRMMNTVKQWLTEGQEVRIFTARVYPINECVSPDDVLRFVPTNARDRQAVAALRAIQAWCRLHVGRVLPVTNVKDYGMVSLYDDRCVQVRANTGELVE